VEKHSEATLDLVFMAVGKRAIDIGVTDIATDVSPWDSGTHKLCKGKPYHVDMVTFSPFLDKIAPTRVGHATDVGIPERFFLQGGRKRHLNVSWVASHCLEGFTGKLEVHTAVTSVAHSNQVLGGVVEADGETVGYHHEDGSVWDSRNDSVGFCFKGVNLILSADCDDRLAAHQTGNQDSVVVGDAIILEEAGTVAENLLFRTKSHTHIAAIAARNTVEYPIRVPIEGRILSHSFRYLLDKEHSTDEVRPTIA
jgi:hypothetical protein